MKLCWQSSVSNVTVMLALLMLFIAYDATHHVVDAKPKFLNFFRSPNHQQYDYQQPYEPFIERPNHFGPQAGGGYAWSEPDRQQPHQHQRHHAQTNGKERYNEICRVIHGIGHCH